MASVWDYAIGRVCPDSLAVARGRTGVIWIPRGGALLPKSSVILPQHFSVHLPQLQPARQKKHLLLVSVDPKRTACTRSCTVLSTLCVSAGCCRQTCPCRCAYVFAGLLAVGAGAGASVGAGVGNGVRAAHVHTPPTHAEAAHDATIGTHRDSTRATTAASVCSRCCGTCPRSSPASSTATSAPNWAMQSATSSRHGFRGCEGGECHNHWA